MLTRCLFSMAAALCLLTLSAGTASVLTATTASAQGSRITPFPLKNNGRSSNLRTSRRGGVSISVSYQFFIEGAARSIADQAKMSEDGRRAVYTLLAKECEALLSTIAESCEISRANVSSQMNSQVSRYRPAGVRVSGSATYRITLKGPADAKDDDSQQ